MGIVKKTIEKNLKEVAGSAIIGAAAVGIAAAANAIEKNSKNKSDSSNTNNTDKVKLIYPSKNAEDFLDYNAISVARALLGCGFNEVELVSERELGKRDAGRYGWVSNVSINGDDEFSRKKQYPENAYIVIEFQDFKANVDSTVLKDVEVDLIQPGVYTRNTINNSSKSIVKPVETKAQVEDLLTQTQQSSNISTEMQNKNLNVSSEIDRYKQCKGCGATSYVRKGGYYFCEFCGMKITNVDSASVAFENEQNDRRLTDIDDLENVLKQINKAKSDSYDKLRNFVPIFRAYDDFNLEDDKPEKDIEKRMANLKEKGEDDFNKKTSSIRFKTALISAIGHVLVIVIVALFELIPSFHDAYNLLMAWLVMGSLVGVFFMFLKKTEKLAHIIISASMLVELLFAFTQEMPIIARILMFIIVLSDSLFLIWNSFTLLKLRRARKGLDPSPILSKIKTFDFIQEKPTNIDDEKETLLEYLKIIENIKAETNDKIRMIRRDASFECLTMTPGKMTEILQLLKTGKANSISDANYYLNKFSN